MSHITLHLESVGKIKVNKPGRQKFQGRDSWQWVKHVWLSWLYFELFFSSFGFTDKGTCARFHEITFRVRCPNLFQILSLWDTFFSHFTPLQFAKFWLYFPPPFNKISVRVCACVCARTFGRSWMCVCACSRSYTHVCVYVHVCLHVHNKRCLLLFFHLLVFHWVFQMCFPLPFPCILHFY